MKNAFFLASTALLVTLSPALAADQDYAPAPPAGAMEDLRGNIHVGTKALIDTSSDETGFIPELRIGTKVAYEPLTSNFGLQGDLEYGGTPLSLVSPEVGASGNLHNFTGTLHATWQVSDMIKLGAYAGYEGLSLSIDGIDAESALGIITLDPTDTEASVKAHAYAAGVEAMAAIDPTSWVQVRAGVIDPVKLTASASSGGASAGRSAADSGQDVIGFQLGAGYRAGFADNWSVRADLNYTQYLISGDDDLAVWNGLASLQYSFSDMPLAWSASVGYVTASSGEDSSDWWVARTGMSWSFGDTYMEGLRGRLFRSVNYLGDVN